MRLRLDKVSAHLRRDFVKTDTRSPRQGSDLTESRLSQEFLELDGGVGSGAIGPAHSRLRTALDSAGAPPPRAGGKDRRRAMHGASLVTSGLT